ncbi:FMN-dependent NADH-azoreductase [Reyranella sp.]|uniref:FMN-dependent NADH-azoreductase n=1 Tax=Reyranella sp. TaxID=1929291 RepID=UPI001217B39A|nr:FMN-dependent NADH-azoreductase [Reyranella sp.]TAJ88630.1 MAG: FMN-dependent NADH-azoreductase [Reyranella sp.]
MKLLHIDSSISGEASVSRQLSAAVVSEWKRRLPDLQVIRRDLAGDPLPHLDGAILAAQPGAEPTTATRAQVEKGTAVLEEFLAADVIVLGAPMYNFAISSQLKAWLDRIVVAGRTFKYDASGVKGLAGDKKVIVASSRGGLYAPGTPHAANDFQEPYLRAILGFIGITDIEVVRAEGVAFGAEQREQSIKAAIAGLPTTIGAVANAA